MPNGVLNSSAGGQAGFASTQWGLLLAVGGAAGDAGSRDARAAWEDLYRTYCYPVYAFIRRRGHARPQAQDLTHDFFVHLIERGTLGRAEREKGRFRTFLLAALEYFLVDVARRESARKHGGGSRFVFLDDPDTAEREYQLAAPVWQTPERLFEARWATALVGATFARLRAEMTAAGKGDLFEVLKDYVSGEEDASYQRTANALGLSLGALKSAIRRLRQRYAELVREEVARTIANPAELEAEVSHLRSALRAN